MFGEASDFFLGEDLFAVGDDDKFSATAFDELGLDIQFVFQCAGQTGRLGIVVSFNAVFDGDVHDSASFPFVVKPKSDGAPWRDSGAIISMKRRPGQKE